MTHKANPNLRNTGLHVNYVPQWGSWEALRELIQNHMDGCVSAAGSRNRLKIDTEDFNVCFRFYNGEILPEKLVGEITYDPTMQVLKLWNTGLLCTKNLLLGGTLRKSGNVEAIGIHGEGQKLGALALSRDGKSVDCRSGGYQWKYSIGPDSFYYGGEDEPECKCLLVEKIPCQAGDVVDVRVAGVSPAEWTDLKSKVLWLTPESKLGRIKTPHGDLLLGQFYRAKLFVKELFICEYNEGPTALCFGYNFWDLPLNRDRKAIEDLNIRNQRTSSTQTWILNKLGDGKYLELTGGLSPDVYDEFLSDKGYRHACYQSIAANSAEFYYICSDPPHNAVGRISANGANVIWQMWKKTLQLPEEAQPIHGGELSSVPAFIREHSLPENFYRGVPVYWLLNAVVKRTTIYKSVQTKFAELLKNPIVGDEYPTTIVHNVISKLVVFKPNLSEDNIKFQSGIPLDYCYVNKDVAFFSEQLRREEKLFAKLLGRCVKLFNIDFVAFVDAYVHP